MEGFDRNYPLFSLCGLNCGLCQMHLGGYCPGCGGGSGNQACAIARCSLQHGSVEYCFECSEFPCGRYDGLEEYDSFISHRNMIRDLKKVKDIGIDAYRAELDERISILRSLLAEYNDGRKKTMYCQTANLLELQDLRDVMGQLAEAMDSQAEGLSLKEKAAIAAELFQTMADRRGVVLKFNKKPKNGK